MLSVAGCILASVVLAGCVSRGATPVPSQTDEIGFRVTGVRVRFQREVGGDYNALCQEIRYGDGKILIECFKVGDKGIIWDKHSWSSETEDRVMVCYLAKVEGADWNEFGFAHLPANMDGVKTNVPPSFNAAYQLKHETRGRIVKRSSETLTWRFTSTGHELVIGS